MGESVNRDEARVIDHFSLIIWHWPFRMMNRETRNGRREAGSIRQMGSPGPRLRLLSYSRDFANFWQDVLTEAMSRIKQPAGGRYRERQRAARGASRHDVPTPQHHSITVAATQRRHRGVSLPMAGADRIVDWTGIQAARTEWSGAWDDACRAGCRAARCRSRYLHGANWSIVPHPGNGESVNG